MATLKLVNGSKKGMWADVTCSYGSGSFSMTKVVGYYTWGKAWDATKNFTHTLNVPNGSTTFQTLKGSGKSGTGIGMDTGGYVWDISPDTVTCSGSGSGYVSIVCSPSLGSNFAGHTFQSESTIDIGYAVSLPSYNSISASSITSSSATLYADINAGGGTISDGGFDVSTNGGSSWNYYSGAWSVNLTGLSRYTTYWYRGYARNEAGGVNSGWSSFTTLAETPTLSAVSISNITYNSVSASFSVTDNGGRGIADYYIDIFAEQSCSTLVKSISANSGTLSGLSPNTTYHARGNASNGSYRGYTAVQSFTTAKPAAPTISSITTPTVQDKSIKVQLNATVGAGASSLQYRFSKDNGSSYTSWQSSDNYTFTGLNDDTSYTFKAQAKDNYETISTSSSMSATTTWVESVKVITSSGVKSARMYIVNSSGKTKVHKRNIKTI